MPATLSSIDPATGEAIGEVNVTEPEAVAQAVEQARQAQASWADRSLDDRLSVLEAFQARVLADRDELARSISRESGKPRAEARVADLMPTLEMVDFLDRHGRDVMRGESFRLENPLLLDRTSTVRREPLGVVGVIAPWNYPFSIPATQALTALFAGNAVVLKPSELTPLAGEALVDRLHRAGVPEEVLHLVHGGSDAGAALVEAEPDKLVFTGSVETGRTVASEAGRRGVSTTLELGGKDPMLVLDDANVGLAARGAAWAGFTNAGQTCAAVERVYVDASVAEPFLDALVEATRELTVGPGLEEGTEVGPMIRTEAVDRVASQVQDAREKGAAVLVGGERLPELGERFYAPTVLADVDDSMVVMREETFGPVVPVQVVEDEREAVREANATDYGLTASVWTTRPGRGETVAAQLDAGTVTINDHAYTYAACETPWGGVKSSGIGRTHGRWGIEDVTRLEHVNRARGGRGRSPWYFPYDEDLDRLGDDGLELLYGSKLEGLRVLPAFLRRFLGGG